MSNNTITKSGFSRRSTTDEVTENIDLSGKVILITGVNSGLGYESMRALCARGAHVIGAARTLDKAQKACDSVTGKTTTVACELSDPASVVACAETIRQQFNVLDVILGNAGIMTPAELGIATGYADPLEMQFAANHMGHFVLVNQLLGLVKAAPQGRVVLLSSMGHMSAPKDGIDFDNLDCHQGYNPMKTYGRSKLANVLMAAELDRRLEGSNVTANSVHPGVIRTNLSRDSSGLFHSLISLMANFVERTIPQGAATQCYVATHPSLSEVSGCYFADCNVKEPSKHAQDEALAKRLWEESERLADGFLV